MDALKGVEQERKDKLIEQLKKEKEDLMSGLVKIKAEFERIKTENQRLMALHLRQGPGSVGAAGPVGAAGAAV